MLLMMNSSRARPDAGIRDLGEAERALRVADVHHHLDRHRRHAVELDALELEIQLAVVDEAPVSPSAHDTVTRLAVLHLLGRIAAADHGRGTPSSRAMIAAWQVRPPRLMTIADARFMIGSQSGSVMSVTSTSPSAILSMSSRAR